MDFRSPGSGTEAEVAGRLAKSRQGLFPVTCPSTWPGLLPPEVCSEGSSESPLGVAGLGGGRAPTAAWGPGRAPEGMGGKQPEQGEWEMESDVEGQRGVSRGLRGAWGEPTSLVWGDVQGGASEEGTQASCSC